MDQSGVLFETASTDGTPGTSPCKAIAQIAAYFVNVRATGHISAPMKFSTEVIAPV